MTIRRRMLASSAFAAPAIVHMSAYANTLTRLFPDLYAGLWVASRELTGFNVAAYRNTNAERAAMGQAIVYPIANAKSAVDILPAMQVPEPRDTAFDNGSITITKARAVEFGWTGEEQRGVNFGPGYLTLQAMAFAEGVRTLANEQEADLAAEAAANASRAYGTPGVTPFAPGGATPMADAAQVRKILDDNGAPLTGRSLIIDTSAGANLRSVPNLVRVNEAGTSLTLRDGQLLDLSGFSVKESAFVPTIVASNGAGGTTNTAGYAKGATVITLAAAGTGAYAAGQSVTFAGDTNKYTIAPGGGDASATDGGTITLVAPGLRQAIPAAATAITIVATHVANIAMSQYALHLVSRAPAMPMEGDLAIDRRLITDPRSGSTFEVSLWPGYRKVRAEIAQVWGVKAVNPNHIAMLLG